MLSPGLIRKPFEQKPHGLLGQLIVSVASYEPRFPVLARTLSCLLKQTVRADETRLYIAAADAPYLPREVMDLEADGLSIHVVEKDRLSYNKLVHALGSDPGAYIAVADDDLYADPFFLEDLVDGAKTMDGIICHRAHGVTLDKYGRFMPYIDWLYQVPGPITSHLLYPSSGAGALFPPGAFAPEVLDAGLFTKLAETTDDIWWFFMAARAGTPFSKIEKSHQLVSFNGSQNIALWKLNGGGYNDNSLRGMYRKFGMPEAIVRERPVIDVVREGLRTIADTHAQRGAEVEINPSLVQMENRTIRRLSSPQSRHLAGPG